MSSAEKHTWIDWLDKLDRRVVYGVMMLLLLATTFPYSNFWPKLAFLEKALPPAKLPTAKMAFDTIEQMPVEDEKIVFIAIDWSGSTKAENQPQTEAIVEHLMRRRIKFALISEIPDAEPFLLNIPLNIARKLEGENPGQKWEYGRDWVDLGYRPALGLLLQQIPKTEDLRDVFKTDARGNLLREVECMRHVSRFEQVPLLIETTGLVGALEMWLAYFQSETHRPKVIHGCTSISIPRNFIFLDSGQLSGLLEGVAGAAYYQELLGYSKDEPTAAMRNMSGVSIGQIFIVALIILGNVGMFLKSRSMAAGV